MEHEVSRFLRKLGYPAARDQTSLAKSVAATCRGNGKHIWGFLLANVKSPEEKQRIEAAVSSYRKQQAADQAGVTRQQECSALRAQLQQLELQASNLERRLATYEGQVHSQLQDMVEESSKQRQYQQTLQNQSLQVLTLEHASWRCEQMQQLVQLHSTPLQQVEAAATNRCISAADVPEAAGGTLPLLEQLMQQLTGELQSHATQRAPSALSSSSAWLMQPDQQQQQPPSAPEVLSAAGPGVLAGYTPSAAVEQQLEQLVEVSPAVLVACAAELVYKAMQQAAQVLAEAEVHFAALLQKYSRQQQPSTGTGKPSAGQAGSATQSLEEFLPAGVAASCNSSGSSDGGTQFMGMAGLQLGGPIAAFWEAGPDAVTPDSSSSSSEPDPETLVWQRQQLHLRLYLDTRSAQAAARKLQGRLAARLRRAGGVALASQQRLQLVLAAAGLRAQVDALQGLQQQCGVQVEGLEEAEEDIQDKWQQIMDLTQQDQELTLLLAQLSSYSMQLYDALAAAKGVCQQQLQRATLPAIAQAQQAAKGGRETLGSEAAALQQLPLAALAPRSSGVGSAPASNAGASRGVLHQYQVASQQLCSTGRPSALTKVGPGAAGEGGGQGVLEGPLVAAMQALQQVDEAAAIKCPAGLLQGLAERVAHMQQLTSQVQELRDIVQEGSQLVDTCTTSASSAAEAIAAKQEADATTTLPSLQGIIVEGQEAKHFADTAVMQALLNWWQQPGQHAAPSYKYDGRNCSEWLSEVEALCAHKLEMAGNLAT